MLVLIANFMLQVYDINLFLKAYWLLLMSHYTKIITTSDYHQECVAKTETETTKKK